MRTEEVTQAKYDELESKHQLEDDVIYYVVDPYTETQILKNKCDEYLGKLIEAKKNLDITINAINSAVDHNIINCVARGIDPRTDDTNVTLCNALEQIYQKEQK